jgi:hypothetical protein
VSQPAVYKALRRGLLDLTAGGKIDPTGPRTRAWLDNHKPKVIGLADHVSAPLAERAASLMSREYDLMLARANSVDRAQLAGKLYSEAQEWERLMRSFPTDCGAGIAALLGLPASALVPYVEAAMTTFLRLRGDQHQVVDAALDQAAARWHQFPAHKMEKPPSPPPFEMPATLAAAQTRYAYARGELARIRMRLRCGELLAQWPARAAAEGLRIGWIQAAQDEFVAAHGAELLAAAGLNPEHTLLWSLWMVTIERVAAPLQMMWPDRSISGAGVKAMAEARQSFAGARARRDAG